MHVERKLNNRFQKNQRLKRLFATKACFTWKMKKISASGRTHFFLVHPTPLPPHSRVDRFVEISLIKHLSAFAPWEFIYGLKNIKQVIQIYHAIAEDAEGSVQ